MPTVGPEPTTDMTNKMITLALGLLFLGGLGLIFSGQINLENRSVAAVGSIFSPDTPLRVGVILPLTGDFSSFGTEVRRGVELGVDAAVKNGYHIDAIYEDAKSDFGAGPLSATHKVLTVDDADIGLTMVTEQAKPIIPVFDQHKIPLLVVWDSNKALTEAGVSVFSSGFSTEGAGEQMAEYAYSELGLRRIAILQHKDAWAEVIAPAFAQKFQSLGGTIVLDEKVDLSVTDYRTIIARIKQTNADGTYFPLIPPTNAQFIIQARQYSLPGALLTADAFQLDVIRQLGDVGNGIYYTNIHTNMADELARLYQAKFGEEAHDVAFVSMGYDGIAKIIEAANIRESLMEGMLEVFGPSRSADKIEKVFKIVEGKPVEVE